MSDLSIQQSQEEFEHMARLQQERARDRQTEESTQSDPVDNFEYDDIDPEDLEEVKINVPTQPSFPLAMFALALLIDTSIIFTGGLLGFLFGGIYALILWLWARGKVGMVKKFIIKILTKKMRRYCIKKSIPILNWLPQSAYLILWLHYRETKYVGDILKALEHIEQNKVLGQYKVAYAAYKTYKTAQRDIKYAKSIYDVATGESTVGQEAGKRIRTKTASHVTGRYYQG